MSSRINELQEQYLKEQQNKIPVKAVYAKGKGGLILINWRQDNKVLIPFLKHRIWPWKLTKHVLKICRQVQHEKNFYIHITSKRK